MRAIVARSLGRVGAIPKARCELGTETSSTQATVNGRQQIGLVVDRNCWVDDQHEASEAMLVFLLDELVVESRAAKALRQHALEDVLHVAAHQANTLRGELLEATNVAHVGVESHVLERAAAGTFFEDAVVVDFGVEQYTWSRRQQGRQLQRID